MKVYKIKHKAYGTYCFFGGLRKDWKVKPDGIYVNDAHWTKRGRQWAKKSSAQRHFDRFAKVHTEDLAIVEFDLVEKDNKTNFVVSTNPILSAPVIQVDGLTAPLSNLGNGTYLNPVEEPLPFDPVPLEEIKSAAKSRIANMDFGD